MLFSRHDLNSTQQEGQSWLDEQTDLVISVLGFVAKGMACFTYVFVRRVFGREYFTPHRVVGALVAIVGGSLCVPMDERPLYTCLMAVFMLLVLIHKCRRSRRDDEPSSLYIGWPLICDVLPISENQAKTWVEPGVVIMLGIAIAQWNKGLGTFVVVGGIACILDFLYLMQRDYVIARRMHDAAKRQQAAQDAYDRHYGK